MTREEAIEVIKAYRDKLTNSASNQLDGDIEALEMAIKALKQNESAEKWYKLFVEKLDEQEPCIYDLKNRYCPRLNEHGMLTYPQEPMRDFTEEEAKAYSKALDRLYKPTGLNVFNEPYSDAVSREAVYSILKEYHLDEEEINSAMDECQNLTVNAIASDVSLLPSVTQKSGKWIKGKDEYGTNHFTCPFCGHDIATKAENWDDNYCANCGADLRGAE